VKASQAGTEGYICKRSILADSQHTLTQRCFAGDMCAFSMDRDAEEGDCPAPTGGHETKPNDHTSDRSLSGSVQGKVGTGFTRVFERPSRLARRPLSATTAHVQLGCRVSCGVGSSVQLAVPLCGWAQRRACTVTHSVRVPSDYRHFESHVLHRTSCRTVQGTPRICLHFTTVLRSYLVRVYFTHTLSLSSII
jgi:hypothetical protein